MKVLTRNGIRANAALNSEGVRLDGDPIRVRHPRRFGPVFRSGNTYKQGAADPLSLNHYGSTYRFIDSRDTFSEGHPVVCPASPMRP